MSVVIAMGSAHIRHIERASARRIRQMTNSAMAEACNRARAQGAQPIGAVDDLSVHSIGPWIEKFAACLARSAKREGISVVGGEMAQMPDSYSPGYAGIVVSVVALGDPP